MGLVPQGRKATVSAKAGREVRVLFTDMPGPVSSLGHVSPSVK